MPLSFPWWGGSRVNPAPTAGYCMASRPGKQRLAASSGDHSDYDSMADRRGGGATLGANAEIQENITALGKQNLKLERMLAKLGTKADTQEFRARLEKDLKQTNKMAKQLMDQINKNTSDMKKKLAAEFSKEFKRFQALHEEIRAKDSQIMRAMNKREGKSADSSPTRGRSVSGEEDRPLRGQQSQAMAEEDKIEFVEYDVQEIEERHERIMEIERDVVEVSEMFKDLQTLVNEQDVHIKTIGDNITRTKESAEQAQEQLLEAETLQGKARKKKCCVLFILLGLIAGVVLTSVLVSK